MSAFLHLDNIPCRHYRASWQMADPFEEMVARLYEAVLDPALRQETLDHFTALLGANTCVQHVAGTDSAPGFTASSNVDLSSAELYQRYYCAVDPWLERASALRDPGLVICSELMPQTAFARSEFYQEFLKTQDLYWGASLLLETGPGSASYLSPMRARNQGDFSAEELHTLQRLLPHFQLSIKLQRRLRAAESRHKLLEATLDSLHCGIFLLDERGKVLFHNAVADQVLEAGTPLTMMLGRLRARDPSMDRRLAQLMEQAGSSAIPMAKRSAGAFVARGEEERESLEVLVAPFRHGSSGPNRTSASVMVLVSEESPAGDHRAVLLRQIWGLTRAEAACATALAEGDSVAEAAVRLQCSPNTIRAHVRSLFQKTGTNRQGALIAAIHRRLALLGVLAAGADT